MNLKSNGNNINIQENINNGNTENCIINISDNLSNNNNNNSSIDAVSLLYNM